MPSLQSALEKPGLYAKTPDVVEWLWTYGCLTFQPQDLCNFKN